MNAPASGPTPPPVPSRDPVLFATDSSHLADGAAIGRRNERNWLPWIVAAVIIVLLVGLAFLLGGPRRPQSSARNQANPYASHVVLSHIQMSQASNFAGGQLTYLDGTVTNQGNRTITSVTVEALFANDAGEPPQAEQVPFTLIRTREPYVDIEPVNAAPLAPGASQDFRLIFEDISPMWNQQLPQIKVLNVGTKEVH